MRLQKPAVLGMTLVFALSALAVHSCGVKQGGTPVDTRYRCSGTPQSCLKLPVSWVFGGMVVSDMEIGDLWAIRLTDGRIRLYGGKILDISNLRGIESYISDDGVHFTKESGYRLYGVGIHAPVFTRMDDGSVRAYYVDQSSITPQPVRSAISTDDGWSFVLEEGERLVSSGTGYELYAIGGPRVVRTKEGTFRMYYSVASDHERTLSAISTDGLNFTREAGVRLDAKDYCPAQTGMGGAPVLGADGLYHYYCKATRCTGDWIDALTGIYDLTSSDGLTFTMPSTPIATMYYIESLYHGNATDPSLVPADPAVLQTPDGMRVFFALYENPKPNVNPPEVGFYTILNSSIKAASR